MGKYLETIYFTEETGKQDYPQKLCTHLYERFFAPRLPAAGRARLLDIGSGKGNHLIGFARCGLDTYGIDKRDECIEAQQQFDVRDCDIEHEPFPYEDDFFDFVFSKSVLEHVTHTDNFLSQALRVLRPGGTAVLLTPDWRSQRDYFWDDYTHVKAFTRKGLQNALRIHGFEDGRCEYFLQLPFLWERPYLRPAVAAVALLPDALKWRDRQESQPRKLIRFSKEKMLLATGRKCSD